MVVLVAVVFISGCMSEERKKKANKHHDIYSVRLRSKAKKKAISDKNTIALTQISGERLHIVRQVAVEVVVLVPPQLSRVAKFCGDALVEVTTVWVLNQVDKLLRNTRTVCIVGTTRLQPCQD